MTGLFSLTAAECPPVRKVRERMAHLAVQFATGSYERADFAALAGGGMMLS